MTGDLDAAEATASASVDLGIPSIGPAHEIGRGAAGVVYRAEQPAFSRTVAVKLLPFAALDEAARARFERECRAMGSVSGHPGIVTVYEAGFTPAGQPYILMELMDGGSLEQRLAMRGPFQWEEVVEIGVRLAGALEVAHRKGILHRDIKPDNVLVSTYGEAKLADFSIARVVGATKTQTGLVAATPAHAPPEVLRGEDPSVRGDVYSLASTLWALLAGGPAFLRADETTIFPLLRRVEEDPVPDLRPRGIPDPICRVLERGMSKDPMIRPASANEFGAELLAARDQARAWLAAGVPPVMAPPGTVGPPPPPLGAPGAPFGGIPSNPQLTPHPSPVGVPPPGAASPAPGAGWPAPPAPATAAGGGGVNRTLLIVLGAVAAAAAVVLVVVLLSRSSGGGAGASTATTGGQAGGSTTTESQTSTDTGTGTGTDTGTPGDLGSLLLTASDVGQDFSDSTDAQTKFADLKPCLHDIPLGGKKDEANAGFASSSQEFVGISLATFQPGEAQKYLDVVAGAGGCAPYQETSGGFTLHETLSKREGDQIGDQTVRYQVIGKTDIGIDIDEEVVLVRKGDTVAMVVVLNPGSPDASLADSLASAQADKI